MKRICTLLISLFITGIAVGQSISEVYIPRYIITGGTDKVPFAYRITFNDLKPNATYRYNNRFVAEADTAKQTGLSGVNGFGIQILINKTTGVFTRVTQAANLSSTGRYGEFTTDASGSYTGWFMNESNGEGVGFYPGFPVYIRIVLNNGAGGTSADLRLSASSSPINVIGFGTGSGDATALRSTPATSGIAKNFVMLYDNTSGRPVAGTVIEGDGVANTSANAYAEFYDAGVNEAARAWGTIIPNNLPGGIQKIVQYNLAEGSRVGSKSSSNGFWPAFGGGTISTVNASGGLNNVIVIDGAAAPLSPPAPQTITFSALTAKTYGDGNFNPGATVTSGLPVTYSSSNVAVADTVRVNGHLLIAIKGAGTADITASQPGDDDFIAAAEVIQTLTVNKAPLAIKANKQYWLRGTPMPDLTVAFTGFVNGDDSTDLDPRPVVSTTATSSSPVGHYPVTVTGAGSPNYHITYESDTMFVVSNKQAQAISFGPLPGKVYGNADFDPGASANSNLPVTYTSSDTSIASINTINNRVHIKKAGTVTITAAQPGNDSYEAAMDVSQLLTVNKAALTITAVDTSRFVGQPNPAFRLVYSGFVNGDNNMHLQAQPAVTTTATVTSTSGKYSIIVNDAASDNYDITYRNGELTVDPLPAQTITFAELPAKKYGDADFWPGAKASSGLSVTYSSSNTNVATIVRDTLIHLVGVGTAVITASQPGNATYAPAPDVTQILTVQKAYLTVRANNQTKNEGQLNPALTITYAGFVNGDDSGKLATLPTANTMATTTSVAGTYRINVQGATSPHYTINHQPGILTVLPPQGEAQDNINAWISSPGQLKINVYTVNVVKVSVQLFDLNGSRVINTSVTLNKGFSTCQIPVGSLSPGIYNVRVAGGDVLLKTKVIIP